MRALLMIATASALMAGDALACKPLTKAESALISKAIEVIRPRDLTRGLDKNLKGCIHVYDLLDEHMATSIENGLYRCDFFRMDVIDALPNSTYTLAVRRRKYRHVTAISPIKKLRLYTSPVNVLCLFKGKKGGMPSKILVLD